MCWLQTPILNSHVHHKRQFRHWQHPNDNGPAEQTPRYPRWQPMDEDCRWNKEDEEFRAQQVGRYREVTFRFQHPRDFARKRYQIGDQRQTSRSTAINENIPLRKISHHSVASTLDSSVVVTRLSAASVTWWTESNFIRHQSCYTY